jgi:hypothetical protein
MGVEPYIVPERVNIRVFMRQEDGLCDDKYRVVPRSPRFYNTRTRSGPFILRGCCSYHGLASLSLLNNAATQQHVQQ